MAVLILLGLGSGRRCLGYRQRTWPEPTNEFAGVLLSYGPQVWPQWRELPVLLVRKGDADYLLGPYPILRPTLIGWSSKP